MKATNVKITDYQEFSGAMVHGTIDGIVFSEYVKLVEGIAVVERVDSNIKCNMQDELSKVDANIDDIFDALEEAAQDLFKALYIAEYDKAITALVPDFDTKADKESASPWCLYGIDEVKADTVGKIETAAKANAIRNALEIAQLLVIDFENVDNMPRIILIHGTTYNIYDVNNCLDVFGRCENGLDFEAIKEAFNRAPKMMGFDAFKEMAQSFEE